MSISVSFSKMCLVYLSIWRIGTSTCTCAQIVLLHSTVIAELSWCIECGVIWFIRAARFAHLHTAQTCFFPYPLAQLSGGVIVGGVWRSCMLTLGTLSMF